MAMITGAIPRCAMLLAAVCSAWVERRDAQGDVVWRATQALPGASVAHAVVQGSDGDLLVSAASVDTAAPVAAIAPWLGVFRAGG